MPMLFAGKKRFLIPDYRYYTSQYMNQFTSAYIFGIRTLSYWLTMIFLTHNSSGYCSLPLMHQWTFMDFPMLIPQHLFFGM